MEENNQKDYVESQVDEMAAQMNEITYNTLKGDFIFYEDENGLATDPKYGLYRAEEEDEDLKSIGLTLDVGKGKYLQPITIQTEGGMLVPIPTGDEEWYKWEVLMTKDNMSFQFNKDEYYQAITVLMKYDELMRENNDNEA